MFIPLCIFHCNFDGSCPLWIYHLLIRHLTLCLHFYLLLYTLYKNPLMICQNPEDTNIIEVILENLWWIMFLLRMMDQLRANGVSFEHLVMNPSFWNPSLRFPTFRFLWYYIILYGMYWYGCYHLCLVEFCNNRIYQKPKIFQQVK